MKFKSNLLGYKAGALLGVVLVFVVGMLALNSGVAWIKRLTKASYDLCFDFSFSRPSLFGSPVVIVYMDAGSYNELRQPEDKPWDRALHAKLLDRLTAEGAKAVVMDIIFSDPGSDAAADNDLAEAIRRNGHVVLAADYQVGYASTQGGFTESTNDFVHSVAYTGQTTMPYDLFKNAAAKVGLDGLMPDSDLVVRRQFPGFPNSEPSLAWAAAQVIGLPFTHDPAERWKDRWLYYYGPSITIPNVTYANALNTNSVAPGFFHDKIVFVGARPIVGSSQQSREELRTPFSSWNYAAADYMPNVEIHATQFLNLLRGDGPQRLGEFNEILVLAAAAAIFVFGLLPFRLWMATLLAIAGGIGVWFIAEMVFTTENIWFPWLVVAGVQAPSALLYCISFRSIEWITTRRRFEEERRKADLRIREQAALLDKASDAIIVHDLQWRAQYWNRSAEELYGWTHAEVRELDLRNEVFNADEGKMLGALQEALARGEWSGELGQSNRAGKKLIIQSRWTLVRDDAGRPTSILVINTDVTAQKKLEAQFLRTQRMESIGTLAGGIAHDLNNVLTPILMSAELMKMKAEDDFSRKMVNTISVSARRGSDMVKQVLAFARGVDGERTAVQISHLIREMQKIVKETFPKNIEFNADVDDIKPVMGDATQIHQILLNLCVNARDAMPDGGSITVAARNVTFTQSDAAKYQGAKAIEYVLLSVTDTGTGIPPEIIDKIFEPFFTTKEIGKGTGLGLSTVISIIKSHGGFLDLQSTVGRGTAFNVYLPAAASSAPASALTAPQAALWGQGEIVMVVDDEISVLELTKTVLSQYGYLVVTAVNGADALTLLPQYRDRIRVVIIDMMMPVMGGAAAIQAMQLQQPSLRFIAISGLIQTGKTKEQLDNSRIPFLIKPFATIDLLKAVRRLITGKEF